MKTLFAAALALTTAGPALAQSREVSIVSAGSEQAVRLRRVTLSRPFGAQLVDRLTVVGRYSLRGRRLYLVRGDAHGECPARFVVISAAGRQPPVLTEPFGTCSAQATGRVVRGTLEVTMPATAAGGPPVRFGWSTGAMRLLDARPAAGIAAVPGGPAGYAGRAPSSCRPADQVDPATRAEILAEFEQTYPAEFRRTRLLNKATVDGAQLRPLLTAMACLSLWPGSERLLDTARPLFRSHHGAAAFSTLDAIARDPLTNANLNAAIRSFSAEMRYRVGDAPL